MYESEVAREKAEIEEDPHEEMLELELFYQLKGFSPEESRTMAERLQKEPKQFLRTLVHEELGLVEETFPNPWRSTISASVSTAIGGFIPIIPFFFTVGMPAVIASFVISTLAHFVGRRIEGARHDTAMVGERRGDDRRRHDRSGDHVRAWPRVRRPLTSCSRREHRPRIPQQTAYFRPKTAIEPWHSICPVGWRRKRCKPRVMSRPSFSGPSAEEKMSNRILTSLAAILLTASAALANEPGDRKDLQIFKDVASTVDLYTRFTIFDDVSASVKDGVVTLTGKVTMPFKRDEIEKRVAKVNGVKTVRDDLGVLPVSTFDDQLRVRIARLIYGNSNFWNYGIMPSPPIHILVEHGRVTLTGVVNSEVDRMLARSLASQTGALSVNNELKTDAEMQAILEKSE